MAGGLVPSSIGCAATYSRENGQRVTWRLTGAGAGLGTGVVVAAGMGDASVLVIDMPHFRLAPWAAIGATGSTYWHLMVGGLVGVAMEAGGDHVVFDASIPLAAAVYTPQINQLQSVALVTAAGSELGVRWQLGDASSLRVGLHSVLPKVSYRWEGDTHFFEAGLMFVPIGVGFSTSAGWRW